MRNNHSILRKMTFATRSLYGFFGLFPQKNVKPLEIRALLCYNKHILAPIRKGR